MSGGSCIAPIYYLLNYLLISIYSVEDSNNFKTICVFECRGLDPVDFDPKSGWKAQGYNVQNTEFGDDDDDDGIGGDDKNSTVFNDIDLSEKEWANFDHLGGKFVKITEFEFNFVKGKQVKNYLQSLKKWNKMYLPTPTVLSYLVCELYVIVTNIWGAGG